MTQRLLQAVVAFLMLAAAGCAQFAQAPAASTERPPAVEAPPAVAEQWAAAFTKGDLDALMRLYDDDARLWGTSSSQLRKGARAIRQYYAQLLEAFPGTHISLRETDPRVYGDAGVNSGAYTMRRVAADGKVVVTSARFTITYVRRGGQWLIVDQHSSLATR